jgi:hypothetical protein
VHLVNREPRRQGSADGSEEAGGTTWLTSVRSGYASALLSLGKLEPKDQQSLQQDSLWSTALSLRALCQWRLGQYDQALNSANQAQTAATNQRANAITQLNELDRLLKLQEPGTGAPTLVTYWQKLCGLPPPPP